MADIMQARKMIAALPAGDSVKAAQEAARWLDSISQTAGFKLARRYELIDLIDVALKRHGEQLLEQYLALAPQTRLREGRWWKAATDYWRLLGNAYLVCVSQAGADKDAASVFRRTLPSLVARAMRAQMLQIKWIMMRYGHVGAVYWQTIARLHDYAQSGGFIDEVVDIYSGAHGRGTVQQEFLRVLMLGVSSMGGLSPVKQNIAERAIAHFSNVFISGASEGAGLNFIFDLNGSMPPSRVLATPPQGARLFYFGAGGAVDGAQKIIDAIADTGALLSDINLGPGDNIDEMGDTLVHLAFNWEKDLPPRDSERRRVSAMLLVAHGINGILSPDGNGARDAWIVENASEEGYGVIVGGQGSEWLQVGVLIGLRPHGDAPWGAGVVRRIEADALGQRCVGIQVISRAVVPATLCTVSASGARGAPQRVLLLDAEPSSSGYLIVVMECGKVLPRDKLEVTRTADGKTFALLPSSVVESGVNFERTRFKAG